MTVIDGAKIISHYIANQIKLLDLILLFIIYIYIPITIPILVIV